MKGILLLGGSGSRLRPLTFSQNKQLLPIYDKPLFFYPLSTLMLAGMREFIFVSSLEGNSNFRNILGDGSDLGITIEYRVQNSPNGLPDAIMSAADLLTEDKFAVILGDNIFHGVGLGQSLKSSTKSIYGAKIFAYNVANPSQFGVLHLNRDGSIRDLIEKPSTFVSPLAITGLYFLDLEAIDFCKSLSPSNRGELEMVDLLKCYLAKGELSFEVLPRGVAWLDTGTPEALLDAANFVHLVEKRQGQKIGCLEEIAWRSGWISTDQLIKRSLLYKNSYGAYLRELHELERD